MVETVPLTVARGSRGGAAAVARLPRVHADPFDRMLVAQAKTEPLLLLTNDSVLTAYGEFVELVVSKPRRAD